MARVDPADDGIKRFIVRHFCYDPQRRERGHVVVGAFDNEPEFDVCMGRPGRGSGELELPSNMPVARAERPAG